MGRWIGTLLCLLAWSCDRFDAPESSGRLGELTLRFSGRRAVSVPESLRIRVAVDGKTTADLTEPLSSFDGIDLDVAFGGHLSIRANLFAAGDTLETGDTALTMPSVAALRLVLVLRSTSTSDLAWEMSLRSRAIANHAFSDTLRLSGAGVDSAVLSLVGGPPGMTLSGNRLGWTPADTGTFSLKLAVSRWSRTDTLAWSIAVGADLAWKTPPRSLAYVDRAFSDTLRLSGAGVDSAVFSLAGGPPGMALSGNKLAWTPTDTGTFALKLSVSRWSWTDTLDWSVSVRDSVEVANGMVRIPAAGKSFRFGAGIGLDSGIVPTLVSLSGDFDMDRTEVTQKRFDSLFAANYPSGYVKPSWMSATAGDLPVRRIDFPSAVLYCNALSRAAGLDTAYQYDQLTWSNGTPNVWNARVRRNVRGHRLPTEAEWEFAARGGSDSLHPWSAISGAAAAGFANYPVQGASKDLLSVGSLKPNDYGLYDMFGNVAEMVMGLHVDGWTVPDPVDPWGPGIWNWGGYWRFPVRGGSSTSSVERSSTFYNGLAAEIGFRTVLPVAASGQGSIRPGLIPFSAPTTDSVFSATVGAKLDIPFVLWDFMGESLTLSVSEGGPTVSGTSVQWTPDSTDIGLHRFEATAVAGTSGRVSKPFPVKILVK